MATIPTDAVLAAHAAAIHHLAGRVVADVIEIGRRLTDAKRICGHGNFGLWLKREFRWSEDTAERYMCVADLDKLRPVRNLDLPLKGLYLLAAPSTPPEVRDKIIEQAKAGESVSVADIKQTIDTTKGRQQPARKPARSQLGKMLRADRAEYLHQQGERAGTAKGFRDCVRKKYAPAGDTAPPARDDIRPDSTSEAAKLRAQVDELTAELRQRDIKIVGLESENQELQQQRAAQPAGDEPLTVLIELLRQIIADPQQPAWLKLLNNRKQDQANKLISRLQAGLHELTELRQVAANPQAS